MKQQFLDVVLFFADLAAHNLISFKSHQETLDGWSLNELIGHYVAYRKLVSTRNDLLPESDFRLFAVSIRYPQNLTPRVALRLVSDGVYDVDHFTGALRIIVVHQLPEEEQNALLHLFSARPERLQYGQRNYRIRSAETTSLLLDLYKGYELEGIPMPIDMKEWARKTREQVMSTMTPEEKVKFLNSMPPEEKEKFLNSMPPQERLAGVAAEDRLAGLTPDELIKALSPDALEALRRQLKAEEPTEGA